VSERTARPWQLLDRAVLESPPDVVGPLLLGKLVVRRSSDGGVVAAGRIVEVEAYGGSDDGASHAARGYTPRVASMFGGPGTLYVYRSYGLHWCANVVCGVVGVPGAVLLRAVEPVAGVDAMRAARGAVRDGDLCRGPGRLCQALGVTGELDGIDLLDGGAPVQLVTDGRPPPRCPGTSPRIGVSREVDRPWRWWDPQSALVSGPRRTRPHRSASPP
jgi:DNA-3-methyladenine glycosylase